MPQCLVVLSVVLLKGLYSEAIYKWFIRTVKLNCKIFIHPWKMELVLSTSDWWLSRFSLFGSFSSIWCLEINLHDIICRFIDWANPSLSPPVIDSHSLSISSSRNTTMILMLTFTNFHSECKSGWKSTVSCSKLEWELKRKNPMMDGCIKKVDFKSQRTLPATSNFC